MLSRYKPSFTTNCRECTKHCTCKAVKSLDNIVSFALYLMVTVKCECFDHVRADIGHDRQCFTLRVELLSAHRPMIYWWEMSDFIFSSQVRFTRESLQSLRFIRNLHFQQQSNKFDEHFCVFFSISLGYGHIGTEVHYR